MEDRRHRLPVSVIRLRVCLFPNIYYCYLHINVFVNLFIIFI